MIEPTRSTYQSALIRTPDITMTRSPVIAVVDDDASIRQAITSLIRSHGYAVYTFSCAEDFLHSLYFEVTQCLITDVHMPHMSGMELYLQVQEKDARIPVILMSASCDDQNIRNARLSSTCRVLAKPFDDARLLDSIEHALEPRARRVQRALPPGQAL